MCVACKTGILHINGDNNIKVSHVRPRVKAKIQCSATYLFTSRKGTALICFEVIIAVVKH